MKYSKFLFAFTITLIFSTFTFAQSKLYGKVTEVINGKTLTIEPQKGLKVQLELELIEVPEPEQQLHQIVKEHLEKLVLNKYVEFRPKGLSETKTIGQVLLDGVNISQQMIRDGAAWYDITRKTSQTQDEVEFYQTIQFQAKAEKRGIWSVADLQPAWEFRTEKAEKLRQEELKKRELELEAIRKNEKSSPPNKNTQRRGLNQLDLIRNGANKDISTYKAPVDEQEAIKKSIEAADKMRIFLRDLLTVGIRLSDYQNRLAELKYEVSEATRGLSNGKLKILMNENVKILSDMGVIFKNLNEDQFIYYQGFEFLSDRYLIKPVRNEFGKFVLWRKDILAAMSRKVYGNFSKLKQTIEEESKYID